MATTLPLWAQTPPLFLRARLPWMIASFWQSQISSTDWTPRNCFSVKPHLDIRALLQVHRIDETYLAFVECQNHRTGAHAFPEKPHALQQVSIRHARARENHFLSWCQIFRVVNALRILDSHLCQAFRVLRLADPQPGKHLAAHAASTRRHAHAFRRPPRTCR